MPSESPRILFLLAHPDDEFACSMWIRDLVRSGARVECAYLTDGGFGGQATLRRERESLRALARLGVEEGRVRFLGRECGLVDGTLPDRLPEAWQAALAWASAGAVPARIVVPAWEGGHQDHDACHLVGLALCHRLGVPGEQIPLYTGEALPGPWFRVLHPLEANGPVAAYQARPGERLAAVALCLGYVSQWRTWLGLLPFLAWRMLVSGRFPRQPVAHARVFEPPHAGRPLYERRGFYRYATFRDRADTFIKLNPCC